MCKQICNITAAVGTNTNLLIYLKGGLELQVISGGQDVGESGFVCPKTAFTSLHQFSEY